MAGEEELITVSITLEWNEEFIHKQPPQKFTCQVPKGTPLARILEMAADDSEGYRFSTKYYPQPLGHYVTSISELTENNELQYYWMIYESPGQLTPTGIDHFRPEDGSTTTFSYEYVPTGNFVQTMYRV